MARMFKSFMVIIVTIITFYSTDSLNCYKCHSYGDRPECLDPVANEFETSECVVPAATPKNSVVCYTLRFSKDSVARSCVDVRRMDCATYIAADSMNTTDCSFCKTDGCNDRKFEIDQ